jgi:hypothetical protein
MKDEAVNRVWEETVTALLRQSLLVALWVCCAGAAAMTVIVLVPPGLDRWAHLLAAVHRHHRHAGALDEASLRWMLEAAFYACWAATAVLALGLLASWRLLFGGLRRWGPHDRF